MKNFWNLFKIIENELFYFYEILFKKDTLFKNMWVMKFHNFIEIINKISHFY